MKTPLVGNVGRDGLGDSSVVRVRLQEPAELVADGGMSQL